MISDPAWKSAYAHANYKTKKEQDDNSRWYPADNIFAAVGQGDDFVTPLQLANAYAAFANGGTLVAPAHRGPVVDRGRLIKQTTSRRRFGT